MLVLVFDTSIPYSTVGWVKFAAAAADAPVVDHAQMFMPARPGHAEVLLERLSMMLTSGGFALDQVDLIAHGIGPGTFTGLRIGLATARALGISNGIPSVGLSTLRMVAASAQKSGTVVALIDARRAEVYCGAFSVCGEDDPATVTALLPECVLPVTAVSAHLDAAGVPHPRCFTGDGVMAAADQSSHARAACTTGLRPFPVLWIAREGLRKFLLHGADDPRVVEPVYLRAPDARLPTQPLLRRIMADPDSQEQR